MTLLVQKTNYFVIKSKYITLPNYHIALTTTETLYILYYTVLQYKTAEQNKTEGNTKQHLAYIGKSHIHILCLIIFNRRVRHDCDHLSAYTLKLIIIIILHFSNITPDQAIE